MAVSGSSTTAGLLKPEVTDEEITSILRSSTPNVGFYAALTALAIPAPRAAAAAAGYLVVAVIGVLRAHGDSVVVSAESEAA